MLKGTIIENSLKDKDILKKLKKRTDKPYAFDVLTEHFTSFAEQ